MDEVVQLTKELLPNLSTTEMSLLLGKYDEIGVKNIETLQYLCAEDISGIIKLIPARRFILDVKKKMNRSDVEDLTSSESTYHTDHSTSTRLVNSPASSSGSSFSDEPSALWAQWYEIPWEKFPKLFLDSCEGGNRPTEYLRRESIRILVDSIREVAKNPTSKDLHLIAARLVNRYKDALGDKVMGKVIGSGYSSILSNIVERLHNLKRKNSSSASGGSGCGESPGSSSSKNYGCLSTWSVDFDSEKESELIKKKDWMKSEYVSSRNMTCESTIKEYMSDTYPLQRKLINSSSTNEVIKEFPYLFERDIVCQHFSTLTGHTLENYATAHKRKFSLIHCMRKENSPRLRKEIQQMDDMVNETNPHMKLTGFIKVLMAYFREDSLLEFFQPCTDVKTVESVSRKIGAPVIAVIGDLYSPLMLHIVLENKVVKTVDSIDDAVLILFGVYYIFNLEYHPKASQTLEFIQRALIGINPDNGSKKPKRLTKKGCVSSKVITLASHINDF